MNNAGDLINGAVLGSGNNIPNVRFGASQISCGAFVGPYIDPDPGIPAKPRLRAAGISLVGSIAGRATATSKGSRRLVGKLSAQAATSVIPQRRVGRLRGALRITAQVSLELHAKGMLSESLACSATCAGGFHPEFDELIGSIYGSAYLRGNLATITGFSFHEQGNASVRGLLTGGEIYYG